MQLVFLRMSGSRYIYYTSLDWIRDVMVNKFSKWWVVWAVIVAMLTGGCSSIINLIIISPTPQASFTPSGTATTSSTPFQAVTNTPIIIPPTFTPSATYPPLPPQTPLPTHTPPPPHHPIPT